MQQQVCLACFIMWHFNTLLLGKGFIIHLFSHTCSQYPEQSVFTLLTLLFQLVFWNMGFQTSPNGKEGTTIDSISIPIIFPCLITAYYRTINMNIKNAFSLRGLPLIQLSSQLRVAQPKTLSTILMQMFQIRSRKEEIIAQNNIALILKRSLY